MANEVQGLKRLQDRTQRLPEAAREQMRRANEKNASEFKAKVEAIVPHTGDDKGGDLRSTLVMAKTDNDTGYTVSIGGPEAPYPLHLEAGHMGPDGKPVPGKPFWNSAKRVLKKRAAARASRALNAAIRQAKAGGFDD
ncbi:HK97 gp10 family phage protein [Brevundimonas sp.]|uniref:HK97 gp10 family phage protein n=1 Tax=Brevundimonas sp. TaxID=1871086 RepID=UPI002D712382|nr:HK97 gp10 family phage protein [Brevundimonas sp.]HYC66645.1 HK97 gp10 family phage protein [Brevundimonas sp.]